jgi:hypothetical protein
VEIASGSPLLLEQSVDNMRLNVTQINEDMVLSADGFTRS